MLISKTVKSGVYVEEYTTREHSLPPVGSLITNGRGSAFTVKRHADVVVGWEGFRKAVGPCVFVNIGTVEIRVAESSFLSGEWYKV